MFEKWRINEKNLPEHLTVRDWTIAMSTNIAAASRHSIGRRRDWGAIIIRGTPAVEIDGSILVTCSRSANESWVQKHKLYYTKNITQKGT